MWLYHIFWLLNKIITFWFCKSFEYLTIIIWLQLFDCPMSSNKTVSRTERESEGERVEWNYIIPCTWDLKIINYVNSINVRINYARHLPYFEHRESYNHAESHTIPTFRREFPTIRTHNANAMRKFGFRKAWLKLDMVEIVSVIWMDNDWNDNDNDCEMLIINYHNSYSFWATFE